MNPGAREPLVLVVEDHVDTREMLTIFLRVWGCVVSAAEDGRQALRLAEQISPDLILMDMKIPLLEGLAVTRLIRSHPTLSRVPIVAVTGMATPQFLREVATAGCNHCLIKPIDFERLKELISVLTQRATQSSLAVRPSYRWEPATASR